jgi:hypothetical protein
MENQAKTSGNSSKGGWIFFLAGFVGAIVIGWVVFPMVLYSKQEQPIDFNHALHMNPDIGIEGDTELERCLFCHGFRDDGQFVGIPKLAKCMECHDDPESPLGDTRQEKEFLTKYVAEDKEVPWLSYYRQPVCVYFAHISHVKMTELGCKPCHGDFGQSKTLPPYEENRLSGYSRYIWGKNISGYTTNAWDSMKMDDCADCHYRMGQEKNNACFVCHK